MANIGFGAYKSMLDWSLKVSTVASPAALFAGLSLGSPTTISFSEVAAGSGYSRATIGFAAAATPAGSASASNTVACTFGPFSSSAAISGIFLSDGSTIASNNMLWYGTLTTARTPLPNDTLVLAASTGLIISLS